MQPIDLDARVDRWINTQGYLPEYRTTCLGTHVGSLDEPDPYRGASPDAAPPAIVRLVFEARTSPRRPWILLRGDCDGEVPPRPVEPCGVISGLGLAREPAAFDIVRAFRGGESIDDGCIRRMLQRIASICRRVTRGLEQPGTAQRKAIVLASVLVDAPLYEAQFGGGCGAIRVRRIACGRLSWTRGRSELDVVHTSARKAYAGRVAGLLRDALSASIRPQPNMRPHPILRPPEIAVMRHRGLTAGSRN